MYKFKPVCIHNSDFIYEFINTPPHRGTGRRPPSARIRHNGPRLLSPLPGPDGPGRAGRRDRRTGQISAAGCAAVAQAAAAWAAAAVKAARAVGPISGFLFAGAARAFGPGRRALRRRLRSVISTTKSLLPQGFATVGMSYWRHRSLRRSRARSVSDSRAEKGGTCCPPRI